MRSRETVSIPVEGMRCAGCAATIERALSAYPTAAATVDLANATVLVRFDPAEVGLDRLVSSVESKGYRVPRRTMELAVSGMHCAGCARTIEQAVGRVPGVLHARVDLATKGLLVDALANVSAESITEAIARAGYEAIARSTPLTHEPKASRRSLLLLVLGIGCSLPLLVLAMGADLGLLARRPWHGWVLFSLALPVQTVVAWDFYRGAFRALRGRSATMDVLIAVGSSAAFLLSVVRLASGGGHHHYFETSALIVTFVRLGKFLEERATRATGDSIRELASLRPQVASVVRDGRLVEVPVEEVRVGDLVEVKAGQSVPVDGVVVEGESAVDESPLTGESLPVEKEPGSLVSAGTRVLNGLLRLEARRVGAETLLARIIRMVQEAHAQRPRIQHLADRVAGVFVPVVLLVACLTFAGWVSLGSLPIGEALVRAVAVLVVACPCALGLATPTAVAVGIGWAARRGILFRSGAILERTASVDAVVFDKTGTLTAGRPVVTDVRSLDHPLVGSDVLRWAASTERGADHPLAKALVEAATAAGVSLLPATGFRVKGGKGVEASIDGHRTWVGRPADPVPDHIGREIIGLRREGKTVIILEVDGVPAGLIALADQPKPEATEVVRALEKLGVGVSILSGDDDATVSALARLLGIGRFHARLLPEEKGVLIAALRGQGHVVAMVGDGINDAPALAASDVGMAVGSGTDTALETSDVVLLGDLRAVPTALVAARGTLRTIRENLVWAFLYNVLLIPVAAMGGLHPVMAAAAMATSSLFVVTNSLRLRGLEARVG